ncbi:type B 50S ribosomal protein L31 [Patescibacteria group bacterium]|nr:type B 50S ribosomal protein L31 [Patescibacteria group bacterium]
MKKDIHPKLNPVVFVDTSCGIEHVTISTLTSDKKKKINGVDHYVINVEISSASHPFYTGKQMLIDTAGRVDKFRARMEAAKKKQEESASSKKKQEDAKKESVEEKITRKAKANTEAKEEEKAKKTAAKKIAAKKK